MWVAGVRHPIKAGRMQAGHGSVCLLNVLAGIFDDELHAVVIPDGINGAAPFIQVFPDNTHRLPPCKLARTASISAAWVLFFSFNDFIMVSSMVPAVRM